MAKCNGKSYLCIDKVTLHPQVDIFDALDVSQKKSVYEAQKVGFSSNL